MLALAGCGGASRDAVAHSCATTDKRFIASAEMDMTALGAWVTGYQSGEIKATEVAEQAFAAAKRVGVVEPKDPSLREAQTLLDAMVTQYGEAVILHGRGKDAGQQMYRAYGLANFAHDVLVQAQPELSKRGCDLGDLL